MYNAKQLIINTNLWIDKESSDISDTNTAGLYSDGPGMLGVGVIRAPSFGQLLS